MKKFYYLSFFMLISIVASAQTTPHKCGTEFTEEMKQRLIANKLASSQLDYYKDGVTTWIPVRFHLVADDNGNGRLLKEKVYESICALNADYADQDIQFYHHGGISEVDNTVIYSHTSQQAAGTQMQIRKDPKAINIFVGNTAGSSSGGGVVLGYYSPGRDLIFAVKGSINSTNNTMSHEIGHFFSLPHTFNGWEDIDYHGTANPSGSAYSTSNLPPTNIGNPLTPVERADGSNCATAGDMFCDTKANYNLGLFWPNCNYTGGAVDPTGAVIDPDEDNFMSYFDLTNCINKFSTEQKGAIAADLATPQRQFLRNNPPNSTLELAANTTVTLQQPPNNGLPHGYDNVALKWDPVQDATHYLLQISVLASFTIIHEEIIVYGTQYNSTSLQANRKYYWKVKPLNEVTSCANFSPTWNFTTTTFTVSTSNIEGIQQVGLQPNLLSTGQSSLLVVDATENFEGDVTVHNISGQMVRNLGVQRFQNGANYVEIPTSDLSAGMYIVTLNTVNGKVSKKLVITD